MGEQPVRMLLVDDHRILRQGVRLLLERMPDIEVIGEADNGRSAVRLALEKTPGLVIMDLIMPDLNGIDATRQIVQSNSDIKVIGLSASPDMPLIREFLRAGAAGYVMKEAAFEELAEAIHVVLQNKTYLSPALMKSVMADVGNGDRRPSVFITLSPREREVLQLMAEGKATKEIAAHLHVSAKTVETHRRNTMEKLQLDSVAELTKYAIREGLTLP